MERDYLRYSAALVIFMIGAVTGFLLGTHYKGQDFLGRQMTTLVAQSPATTSPLGRQETGSKAQPDEEHTHVHVPPSTCICTTGDKSTFQSAICDQGETCDAEAIQRCALLHPTWSCGQLQWRTQ